MQIEKKFKIVIAFSATIIYFLETSSIASNSTNTALDKELNGTFGLRKGRWGIFFSYEPLCTRACQKNGKYSGRMYGGVCRCYCARVETDPCTGTYPSCDRLCRQNFYHLGGDCIDEQRCWCFCTVRQRQAPNSTGTTEAPITTCAPPTSSTSSSNTQGELPGQASGKK